MTPELQECITTLKRDRLIEEIDVLLSMICKAVNDADTHIDIVHLDTIADALVQCVRSIK